MGLCATAPGLLVAALLCLLASDAVPQTSPAPAARPIGPARPAAARAAAAPGSASSPLSSDAALEALRARPDVGRGGIYALDGDIAFNVLESVFYDPATGRLSLVGHYDDRFRGPWIPYLQHLAALLETEKPEFTLTLTPETRKLADAFVRTPISDADLHRIIEALDRMFDESGRVTQTAAVCCRAWTCPS